MQRWSSIKMNQAQLEPGALATGHKVLLWTGDTVPLRVCCLQRPARTECLQDGVTTKTQRVAPHLMSHAPAYAQVQGADRQASGPLCCPGDAAAVGSARCAGESNLPAPPAAQMAC
jgi:hypothetical protein